MTITDKYVLFYGSDWPSNFAPSPITVDDDFWERGIWDGPEGEPSTITFSTAEAYYQSRKAVEVGDKDSYYKIALASTPAEAKILSYSISLNSKKWDMEKDEYMMETLLLKFKQNPDLLKEFLDPKYNDKIFVEASPSDSYWGVGKDKNMILRELEMSKNGFVDFPHGSNHLGINLMTVRNVLLMENNLK